MPHHKIDYYTSGWRLAFIFFLFPASVYFAFITGFEFNLFEPHSQWQAYNQYFLSVIHGHLDIPANAIGVEGLYYDGKAYMYYGALPLLARFLAYWFVDLNETPVGLFSIFLFSVSGMFLLQLALVKIFRYKYLNGGSWRHLLVFIFFSCIIWFNSANFSVVQNGSMYHEPYAASLFLLNSYIAFLMYNIVFDKIIAYRSLIVYAAISALAVHTRPNMALSLYIVTSLLILYGIFVELRLCYENRRDGSLKMTLLLKPFLKASIPFFIMLVGGVSLLVMNYLRFKHLFSTGGVEHYGFFLCGEGYSERFCAGLITGRFNLRRLIPNLIFYLLGGESLHSYFVEKLNLIFIRKEDPHVQIIFLWTLPILLTFYGTYHFGVRLFHNIKHHFLYFVCTICFLINPVLILSYSTITYRYTLDLWAPLSIGMCYTLWVVLEKCTGISKDAFLKITVICAYFFFFSSMYNYKVYDVYHTYWKDDGLYLERDAERILNADPSKIINPCDGYLNGSR